MLESIKANTLLAQLPIFFFNPTQMSAISVQVPYLSTVCGELLRRQVEAAVGGAMRAPVQYMTMIAVAGFATSHKPRS